MRLTGPVLRIELEWIAAIGADIMAHEMTVTRFEKDYKELQECLQN